MDTPSAPQSGDAAPSSGSTAGWTPTSSPPRPDAPATATPATQATPATPGPGLPPPAAPTPEDEFRVRAVRGRMRTLGIIIVMLALVTGGFMAYNVATYEQETLANGPHRAGGEFVVHMLPAQPGWDVRLITMDDEKREFARLAADANGTASFGKVTEEVFRLEATRENTTVAGMVRADSRSSTEITLDSGAPQQAEWLGDTKPTIHAFDWVIIGLFAALIALAVAGGVALARARNPRLASGGAGAAAAIGLLTGALVLSPVGIGLLVAGIWSIFTIRRNPDLFARPASLA